jgi:hypothetical protein
MALTIILLLLTVSWFVGRAMDRLFNRLAGYETDSAQVAIAPNLPLSKMPSVKSHFKTPASYLSNRSI